MVRVADQANIATCLFHLFGVNKWVCTLPISQISRWRHVGLPLVRKPLGGKTCLLGMIEITLDAMPYIWQVHINLYLPIAAIHIRRGFVRLDLSMLSYSSFNSISTCSSLFDTETVGIIFFGLRHLRQSTSSYETEETDVSTSACMLWSEHTEMTYWKWWMFTVWNSMNTWNYC